MRYSGIEKTNPMKYLNNLTGWLKSAQKPPFNLEKEIEAHRLKQVKTMEILNTPDGWTEEKYLEHEKINTTLQNFVKEIELQEEILKIIKRKL